MSRYRIVSAKDFRRCRHERITVDTDTETVQCRDCHTVVDPFKVLVMLPEEIDRLTENAAYWKEHYEEAYAERQRVEWWNHVIGWAVVASVISWVALSVAVLSG